jgi:hypothetical protein
MEVEDQVPSRSEDVERAMRESARVEDPAARVLLTGLIQMQSEILRRLEGIERGLRALPKPRTGGRRPGPS